MKPKTAVLALLLITLVCFSVSELVSAQQAQTSNNVDLVYVKVQLSYPSEVAPGQSVTLSVQATAKDTFEMDRLEVRIYIPIQNNLQQVATATVTQGVMMTTGSQVSKDIGFTVPSDSPRTSLMAVVSESVRTLGYSYYESYPFYGMYYEQNSSYPNNYYLSPSPSYMPSNDNVITPLSYVKATVPEYVSLQSQNQMLQQELNQTQSQNQKLQQDLKAEQDQLAQLKIQADTSASLTQQLASAQGLIQMLEAGIALFAVLAAVFGFLLMRRNRKRVAQPKMNQS